MTSITKERQFNSRSKIPAVWLRVAELNSYRPIIAMIICIVAALIGALVGAGLLIPAGAIAGILIAPLAIYFIVSQYGTKFDALFWILLALMFSSSIISAITRQSLSFVSTAVLLAASPLIILGVIRTKFIHSWLLLSLTIAFFILGIVSSVFGRSSILAGVYSAIIAVKPFLLIGFGCALVWSPKTEKWFDRLVRWVWAPMLIAVLIQWFTPSVYSALLADVDLASEAHPILSNYPRASGIFAQSSIQAAFAAIFGLIALIEILFKRKFQYAIPGAFYLVLLFMSGQRQEFSAAIVMVPLIFLMYKRRPSIANLLISALAASILLLLAIYLIAPDMATQELKNWGLKGAIAGKESARSILYSDASKVANMYFPLGSGFGTFGSVGSIRFDKSLYDELGYHSFWWYTTKSYLMDAYWAKYIAETGWLGFMSHLALYGIILNQIFQRLRDISMRTKPELFRINLLAFSGLTYVLMTSPTAFSLTEINGGLIPLMFIGICLNKNKTTSLAH